MVVVAMMVVAIMVVVVVVTSGRCLASELSDVHQAIIAQLFHFYVHADGIGPDSCAAAAAVGALAPTPTPAPAGRHRRACGRRVIVRPMRAGRFALLLLVRVDRFVVPAQVNLALERPKALVARVGLVARVLARVGDQVRGLTKGFAAHGALVRLLARVNIGVLLHVRLLVEALVAVGAGVGSRVRVDEQVRGEGGRALEGLATLTAQERSMAA